MAVLTPPAFDAERYETGRYTGVLHIMDHNYGDAKIMWDADNKSEVQIAREFYEMMHDSGMMTYSMPEQGGTTVIKRAEDFDPTVKQRVVATPYITGG